MQSSENKLMNFRIVYEGRNWTISSIAFLHIKNLNSVKKVERVYQIHALMTQSCR